MTHGQMLAVLVGGILMAACAGATPSVAPLQNHASDRSAFNHFVESNCLDCHNNSEKKAGLALDDLITADVGRNQQGWEAVVRKLSGRQMPPSSMPRPPEKDYEAAIAWLETSLDA